MQRHQYLQGVLTPGRAAETGREPPAGRRLEPVALRRWLALVLAALSITAGLLVGPATAHAASFPTVSWPGSWANPVGGASAMVTTHWGALNDGCRNVNKTNDATWYLSGGTSGHTGLDIARADGAEVYAIADGIVVNTGMPWGTANRHVVTIEHTTATGEKFLAVYGHLHPDVAAAGPITRGARVGRVQTAGTGPHLHLGIRPGAWSNAVPPGSSASTVDGARNCTFNPAGTADPLGFLSARAPGTNAGRYNGHIVKWEGDAVTAWHVGGDGRRRWIPDALIYGCLRGNGAPVSVLSSATLSAIPDVNGTGATCNEPWGVLDQAPSPGPGLINVVGWALDSNAGQAPLRIHAYIGSTFLGELTANTQRADVGAAFPGYGNHHGYNGVVNVPGGGTHTICTWAINVGPGGNRQLGCAAVTVADPNPFGSFDWIEARGGRTIALGGWAMDPNAKDSPTEVHVYTNGSTFVGALRADQRRADVPRVHPGYGNDHGFSGVLTLPTAGMHTVCIWAINIGPGGHRQIAPSCKQITV